MKKSADTDLVMNGRKITGLPVATTATEPVTKTQGDSTYLPKVASADIDLGGYKIRNSGAILIGDMGVPG